MIGDFILHTVFTENVAVMENGEKVPWQAAAFNC